MRILYKIGVEWMCRLLVLAMLLTEAVLPTCAEGFVDAWVGVHAPKREVRAAWLTTLMGLDWPSVRATSAETLAKQQRELCTALDTLQQAGINTVLFQVRTRGAVLYPSSIEPWDGALTGTIGKNPGYDPLDFVTRECHKRGMELHAWMVTIPYCKVAVAKSLGTNAAIRKHLGWFKKASDTWYLDPSQTETDAYLASICKEIVEKYDVDGIHFDYLRYPEFPFADDAVYKSQGKGWSKEQWRRNNMTRIATHLSKTVKTLKPWVKVSCSPIGKYSDLQRYSSGGWNAYKAVGQDAQKWLREGVMDALFPMMYFRGDNFYPFAANWQEECAGKPVVPGLGIYLLTEKNWDLETFTRELEYVRSLQMGGQAYYRAQFLWQNPKGIYRFVSKQFYPYLSIWPETPAEGVHAPAAPTHVTQETDGLTCTLRWKVKKGNIRKGDAYTYNIYASDSLPVNTEDAARLVATRVEGDCYTLSAAAGTHRYYAVTSMNRYGMESAPVTVCIKER